MATQKRCCGTCRFHNHDDDYDDWFCENPETEEYACFTGFDDGADCEGYLKRPIQGMEMTDWNSQPD